MPEGEDFDQCLASLADQQSFHLPDLRFGGLQFNGGDVSLELEAVGDGEALGEGDLKGALAGCVSRKAAFQFGVAAASGLLHMTDGLLDTQTGRGEVRIVAADTVRNVVEGHDQAGGGPPGWDEAGDRQGDGSDGEEKESVHEEEGGNGDGGAAGGSPEDDGMKGEFPVSSQAEFLLSRQGDPARERAANGGSDGPGSASNREAGRAR